MEPKPIPYNFIFDYLLPLELTVKPLFGMYMIYTGQRIILVLRERQNQPEMNGIWVATNKGHQKSMKRDFPVLRSFSGPKSEDSGAGWQMIPADADDFEATAIKICELIVHRDPRIGKIPVPKRKKVKK